jgi:hypothetical protein
MRYSDMELYGPRSETYRHAVTIRTEGYSMATLSISNESLSPSLGSSSDSSP